MMWQGLLAWSLGVSTLWLWPMLPSPRVWIITAIVTAAVAVITMARGARCGDDEGGRRRSRWLIMFCCLQAGMAWSTTQAARQLQQIVPTACEAVALTVSGRVVDLPVGTANGGVRFLFRPDPDPVCVPAGSRWSLFWRPPAPDQDAVAWPRPGEHWQFRVRLRQPHGLANPGGFDAERYWHHQRIGATGSASQAQRLQAAAAPVDSLRLHIREQVQAAFPQAPIATGLLLALLTGDRAGLTPAMRETLAAGGISHLMAISGLHVTLVAGFAMVLARRLLQTLPLLRPLPPLAALIGLLVAGGYAVLSGLQVPTQRAWLMLAVLVLCRWLPWRVSTAQSLLLALAVVLYWQPLAVLSAGLWLSFVAVAILAAIGLPAGQEAGWRSLLRAQWWMTWGLLPLSLLLFERFSTVGLLLNLLAIPLVSLLVLPLALVALLSALLSWSWALWGLQLPLALLQGLWWLTGHLVSLPGATASWSLPPSRVAALWLLALLLLMPRGLSGRSLLLIVVPVLWWPAAPSQDLLRLQVLDVGQGTAVLISTRHHHLLYDTGPPFGPHADAGERVIQPVLSRAGIGRLQRVVLSHDDADHVGGLASILQAVRVDEVLGDWPQSLSAWPPASRPPHRPCRAGESWVWDGVRFDLLWPPADRVPVRKNDRSCVLRIEAGGLRFLLPGDLEAQGELFLRVDHAELLPADWLLLGHHGSRTSTGEAFLAQVAPSWAVASMGYRNAYGHPARVVTARLQRHGVRLWRTDTDGALSFVVRADGQPPVISRWRQQQWHYWHHHRRQRAD